MTTTDQPQAARSAAIDKERLRQKYLEERNKRLRADGNDQYLQVAGQLAHYLDDPYTPRTEREPPCSSSAGISSSAIATLNTSHTTRPG